MLTCADIRRDHHWFVVRDRHRVSRRCCWWGRSKSSCCVGRVAVVAHCSSGRRYVQHILSLVCVVYYVVTQV